jgi:hypothetical protein
MLTKIGDGREKSGKWIANVWENARQTVRKNGQENAGKTQAKQG